MTVKASSLDNPERDLTLADRASKSIAPEELLALRQRIAAALAMTPKDDTPHCGDCYRRGWKAALQSLQE